MTSAPPGLTEIARDLYGLPPGDFTGERNARAKRARSEGEAALAAAIARLPKPVVAAWVVNILARQRPDRVRDLVNLGEELRGAQSDADATALRTLTTMRRTLIAAVAKEAAALATELGTSPSGAVVERVEATLHAAMTDPRAAEAVRSGLLRAPLTPSLDDVDLTDALAVPIDGIGHLPAGGTGDRDAPVDLSARRASARARNAKEIADAKAELAAAEAAADRTGAMLRARTGEVRTLQAKVLQVRAELDEAMRLVAELEERLEPLTVSLVGAQEASADADALDLAAKAAVERAATRLRTAQSARR